MEKGLDINKEGICVMVKERVQEEYQGVLEVHHKDGRNQIKYRKIE